LESVATEDITNSKQEMIYLVIRWYTPKNHIGLKIFIRIKLQYRCGVWSKNDPIGKLDADFGWL